MKISKEKLAAEAQATGFRPEVLEKVIHLLNLLEGFQSHPFLKDRLALKGGTALNLFWFNLPRLSIDIDLNYVAAVERDTMMQQRPKIEEAVQAVCAREELNITRVPTDHAGGKWRLRYPSALGGGGNLEVDLNFMFRVPFWPIKKIDSKAVGSSFAGQIPVLDLHELAAGKLAAMLSRHASRDLFDAHQLLTQTELDQEALRLAFVLYGAMNRKDWRTVDISDVGYDPGELDRQLTPLVRTEILERMKSERNWAERMIEECREGLNKVLPFTASERDFLDRILDHGEIEPGLLTRDAQMRERIAAHPLLQWKAMNVREHKGKPST